MLTASCHKLSFDNQPHGSIKQLASSCNHLGTPLIGYYSLCWMPPQSDSSRNRCLSLRLVDAHRVHGSSTDRSASHTQTVVLLLRLRLADQNDRVGPLGCMHPRSKKEIRVQGLIMRSWRNASNEMSQFICIYAVLLDLASNTPSDAGRTLGTPPNACRQLA